MIEKTDFSIASHENCTFKVCGNVVEIIYNQNRKKWY